MAIGPSSTAWQATPSCSALRLKLAAQFRIDQREKDQARLVADMIDHALQLPLAAHQRIEMLMHGHAFELGTHRFGDRVERFAGRIRNQMQMKISIHKSFSATPICPHSRTAPGSHPANHAPSGKRSHGWPFHVHHSRRRQLGQTPLESEATCSLEKHLPTVSSTNHRPNIIFINLRSPLVDGR